VSEPKGREAREDKLNRVQKSGLDVAERELGGPQVFAYFGTDVDRGKGAVRVDVDGVVGIGAKGGDEVGGCVSIEVLDPGDMIEELAVDELLGREPDVTTLLVVYCVLMRVSVGSEARRGGEEVLEEADVDGRIKRWYRERSG